MAKTTTAERLKQLMLARKLKQVDILEAAKPFCQEYGVKLGKTDLSQYCSGKVVPGQEKLTILGLALNVNEAWLMGFDVSPERESAPIPETGNGRTAEFARLFSLLTENQQDMIIHAIKGILSDR